MPRHPGGTADTEQDAAMLDGVVRIQQLRTDRADAGLQRQRHHFLEASPGR